MRNPFHKHTQSHTQKSLGWSFIIWRGIHSHALYAEDLDLRHSSGNLCPNSCGLIRLHMDLKDDAVPGIMRGIQSITHLQSILNMHICTCKPFSVCLCTPLSMCNGEHFPAFTLCLQLPASLRVCTGLRACARVLVCKEFRDGFVLLSLMSERFASSFMRQKPTV